MDIDVTPDINSDAFKTINNAPPDFKPAEVVKVEIIEVK
jgi:hypothetical protein